MSWSTIGSEAISEATRHIICGERRVDAPAFATTEQVRAYLSEHFAGYKVPRANELRSDLPREDSGKIVKRQLREPYWQSTGRKI